MRLQKHESYLLDAYSLFNKVTNIFETDTALLTVATGIVMPEMNPLENAANTTFGDNSGIIAYETPKDEVNGTLFTCCNSSQRLWNNKSIRRSLSWT